ncbi:hypothetical protein LYNGBM3L_41360 [Moorena producens 3L]|uniref:Uncharacterized protein n=1 Tax=Moorena producens 3L TaxID=489825 RepID=F4XVK8_9CYAN|nr:hypothetical protein LYNGBM3L_41360 [Moorena producens 3L]OLT66313.1 hypothetical protein BI334_15965 [Moorena producens 3L]
MVCLAIIIINELSRVKWTIENQQSSAVSRQLSAVSIRLTLWEQPNALHKPGTKKFKSWRFYQIESLGKSPSKHSAVNHWPLAKRAHKLAPQVACG